MSAGLAVSSGEWDALRLSLLVAASAAALCLGPGVFLGWLLARRRFRGRAVVETLVGLPLVLPPVVTGWLLLTLFSPGGMVGRFFEDQLGLRIVFTWRGAAIAAAVVAFPLLVRSVRTAFAAVDPRLEAAARTLGASEWRVFAAVSLPLARGGVIGGMALAFARAFGEFGATIMIAGSIPGRSQTVPLAIYDALQSPGGDALVLRLVGISVAVAAAALIVANRLEARAGRWVDASTTGGAGNRRGDDTGLGEGEGDDDQLGERDGVGRDGGRRSARPSGGVELVGGAPDDSPIGGQP
ncbi:MAG: molybdate ABC transporter permease subunit [Phycisphaerales bacterium]